MLRRGRLREYLATRADAPIVLVGEAAGYRGARVSGIAFTSERQLTGDGPAEASATIVHRVLAELGIEDDVLLWNVVPTHPGTATSNRRPTRDEVRAARPFLDERDTRPPSHRRRRPPRCRRARRAVRPAPGARRRARLRPWARTYTRRVNVETAPGVKRNAFLLAASLVCNSGMFQLAAALGVADARRRDGSHERSSASGRRSSSPPAGSPSGRLGG